MASRVNSAEWAVGYWPPTQPSGYVRLSDGEREAARLASEVPVALVYNGRPHVVMMCTPADLEDFAFGFTVSEGIAPAARIRHVDVVRYAKGIELQIAIPPDDANRLSARGRAITGRTGCGLCGVEVIDDALREPAVITSRATFTREALWKAGEMLGTQQPMNDETSAIHAAAWATGDGELRITREDVGRHNALDKVIGALLRADVTPRVGFVVVTSRASYELVQKAAALDIPLLAAVSRPTALAAQLADEAGMTLVGLLRGRTANVYTHPWRITQAT